jgi:hypothetical protein
MRIAGAATSPRAAARLRVQKARARGARRVWRPLLAYQLRERLVWGRASSRATAKQLQSQRPRPWLPLDIMRL